jgi:hypothetical protein
VGLAIPPPYFENISLAFNGMARGERIYGNETPNEGCNNLFTRWIIEHEMAANFKFTMPIVPYDGSTDPQDHIEFFQWFFRLQGWS